MHIFVCEILVLSSREKIDPDFSDSCAYMQYLYPPEASIGYFGLAFTTPRRLERFSALTLSEKTTLARFTKFAGYTFIVG